jgi:hypothetical protein
MKKYAALLLMLASLAGLAWASLLTVRMALKPTPALSSAAPASLHLKEGEDALQRLRRIDQVLNKIDALKPLASQMATGPLAQPAPTPVAAAVNPATQAGKPAPAAAKAAPVISMVYLSTNMQRAVINGKLYASGDSMPDGGRLVTISLNEVVIDYKGRRKVLQVPRSQVSGSTARPVDEQ